MHRIELTSSEGKSLVIHCSPNTKLNLEENEEFRTQIFEDSMRRKEEEDFVPIPPPWSSQTPTTDFASLPSTSAQAQEQALEKAVWLDKDVRLLISLFKESFPDLGKNVLLKTKKKMWEHITNKINSFGKNFSTCQVENKWKTLERAFKIKLKKNKQTGSERTTCPYENELAEILLDRPSILPKFVLGSKLDSGKSNLELLSESGFSAEPITSSEAVVESPVIQSGHDEPEEVEEAVGSPPKKKKRPSTIAGELMQWRKQAEGFNNEKKEARQARLDAYNKRTDAYNRRTDILNNLLSALQNKD